VSRVVFQHALVVGKFYPPHIGHEYLIATALRHSRQVTAMVLASSAESIGMDARAAWLRESFAGNDRLRVLAALDEVRIDYADPEIWQKHVEIMRAALASAGAPAADAVFSSERYGAELARQFSAAHVCLDPTRGVYPVSGTELRQNLAAHWEALPLAVRGGLAARVVVVGAESSGTTTLAIDLERALRVRGAAFALTRRVAEYGREYSANLLALARAREPASTAFDLKWLDEDFEHIAAEQTRREAEAARAGGPVLICDTDAFATCIWQERYLGRTNPRVRELAAALPPRALYLLTDHAEVRFEDDGLRDGEALRPWMTSRFAAELAARDVPWAHLRGDRSERCAAALRLIDARLATLFRFSEPMHASGVGAWLGRG
jgi:NadR type nicotinamide-nucleotide adenylyltransferase